MKIWTDGARHWAGQVSRIDSGFLKLGHELTHYIEEADLIYSNNPWWDEIIQLKIDSKIGGKIIFNVLDIPLHILKEFNLQKLRTQLGYADAVTSISSWTKKELMNHCGIDSSVIYNPIKNVCRDPRVQVTPFFPFCHVGRRFDANKRASIGLNAVSILGYEQKDVCLVGNEGGWGTMMGVLSDEKLNVVYNSCSFVLATGKIEGIGLPAIEAIACGAIPVICNDLTTREEFFPSSIFPEYDFVSPNAASIASFLGYLINNKDIAGDFQNRLHDHYLKNWRHKMSGLGVAESILNVYKNIK